MVFLNQFQEAINCVPMSRLAIKFWLCHAQIAIQRLNFHIK